MRKCRNTVYLICPLAALAAAVVPAVRGGGWPTVALLGLLGLLVIQWLYNTEAQGTYPDAGQRLEKMMSDRMNDPGFFNMMVRASGRGVVFLPTRGIRASDGQQAVAGSWLVVAFTLLGAVIQAEDRIGMPGPIRLRLYLPCFLWAAAWFVIERLLRRRRRKKKDETA